MNAPPRPRWFQFDRRWAGPFRQGGRLYAGSAWTLWRVAVPVSAVPALLGFIVVVAAAPSGSTVLHGVLYAPPGATTTGYTDARWLLIALQALAGVFVTVAATRIFSEVAIGRRGHAEEALSFALRRFGATLWLWILVAVLVVAGFVALIFPGIYAGTVLAVALPVLVVEDLRGGAALKRSRELVKGYFGHTFSAAWAAGIIVGGPSILLQLTLRVNGSVASFTFVQILVGVLLQALLAPFAIAVSVALYFDLRARKEPSAVDSAP
jgi:uncharacterized membrane protein